MVGSNILNLVVLIRIPVSVYARGGLTLTLVTKKSKAAKEIIRKHSKDFNGSLNDVDVMKLTGLSRNTFYKYKRELKETK